MGPALVIEAVAQALAAAEAMHEYLMERSSASERRRSSSSSVHWDLERHQAVPTPLPLGCFHAAGDMLSYRA